MNKISLGQTIQVLANVAVVAGIVFLAMQIRANTIATQAASVQAASALDQEHLLLLGGNPEIARLYRSYLAEPEVLSDDERSQGRYLLSATLRRLENVYLLNQMGALSSQSWESRRGLLIGVARSKGYSDYSNSENLNAIGPDFLEYVQSLR